jgi:hypothetical protein
MYLVLPNSGGTTDLAIAIFALLRWQNGKKPDNSRSELPGGRLEEELC